MADYFSNTSEAEYLATHILHENAFTPDECKKIITFSGNLPEKDAGVDSGYSEHSPQKTKVKYIEISLESSWITQRIMTIIYQANEQFFKYDLHSLAELQIQEYNEGSHYNWHMDTFGHKRYLARKISATVFLSDPIDYQGGKLQWLPTFKGKMEQEQGNIILFPSYKVNRTTTVKKGKRYSLVAWVHGE